MLSVPASQLSFITGFEWKIVPEAAAASPALSKEMSFSDLGGGGSNYVARSVLTASCEVKRFEMRPPSSLQGGPAGRGESGKCPGGCMAVSLVSETSLRP